MRLHHMLHAGAAALLGLSLAAGSAAAQDKPADFPQRPINLVVVYPAGGAVDVTARTFAEQAEAQLGHEFRVENRVGGAGLVGHTYLAKAAQPDGYTVGVLANPWVFTDILLRDAEFSANEFDPIASISFDPVVWVVNAKSDIGEMSFDEIMERGKTDTLQVGMNPNSIFLFVSEFIEKAEGVKFNYIPFDGGRAGVTALLAGDVDATATFYSEIEQYVKNGELRPVAVAGDNRHPLMPDTPTLPELGVPAGGEVLGATRLFALPVGVPEDRKAYLAASILSVLKDDATKAAFKEAGLTLDPKGPEAASASYQETYDRLRAFLKDTGRLSE